jgi:uncharacterized membrane protein
MTIPSPQAPAWAHPLALTGVAGLLVLGLIWEMWGAPLRPGGSWLVLKVIFLIVPIRGIIKRELYTMQWTSMLVLLYFTEGIVRATTDAGASQWWAFVEIVLSVMGYIGLLAYCHPYKRAAKALKKQALQGR